MKLYAFSTQMNACVSDTHRIYLFPVLLNGDYRNLLLVVHTKTRYANLISFHNDPKIHTVYEFLIKIYNLKTLLIRI